MVALGDGAPSGSNRAQVLLIGEAKAGERPLGTADLWRLERARVLLSDRADATGARLALFTLGSFDRALTAEARRRDDVVLVDLDRLCGGD